MTVNATLLDREGGSQRGGGVALCWRSQKSWR